MIESSSFADFSLRGFTVGEWQADRADGGGDREAEDEALEKHVWKVGKKKAASDRGLKVAG